MKKNILRATLTLMLITSSSNAQGINENTRMAIANFAFETMECISFYSVLSNMENNSPEWSGIAENYGNLVEEMSIAALGLANQIQLNPDVLMRKAQQYTSEMGELIGYDGINISLLLENHGENCKSLVEDPAARLQYWMNKEN
jgi:hypothetical protein